MNTTFAARWSASLAGLALLMVGLLQPIAASAQDFPVKQGQNAACDRAALGAQALPMKPEQFDSFIKSEIEAAARIAKAARLQAP